MKDYIIKKLNPPKGNLNKAKEIDIRQISSVINSLNQISTDDSNYPSTLKKHRNRLNTIINDFQRTYKELVSQEITIINLDIAAESLVERNNLVDNIHSVVHKDRIRVYQGS